MVYISVEMGLFGNVNIICFCGLILNYIGLFGCWVIWCSIFFMFSVCSVLGMKLCWFIDMLLDSISIW